MKLLTSLLALILISNAAIAYPSNSHDNMVMSPGEGMEYVNEFAIDDNLASQISSEDSIFIAAKSGDINLMKRLISQGADINMTDEKGWTPLDYAKKNNRGEIGGLLQSSGAITFLKNIPDMYDGPHVRLIDSSRAGVYYLQHDAKNGRSFITGDTIALSDLPLKINGTVISPEDFGYDDSFKAPLTTFKGARKIFVIGDMHGELRRTLEMLRNNGITDNEGNWSWGSGHLVFIGDIFDRGREVTEALWMIFRLQKQAVEKGGRVHMVLGNHEPMIFNNDLRYVTGDYYALCENLQLNYSDLFDNNSLLGLWLRQKPLVTKINNYVFVHAGFSPEFLERGVSLDSVNKVAWRYWNGRERDADTELRELILGVKGVQWYRGLADDGSGRDVIDRRLLSYCLYLYDTEALIIGHTEVDSITSFFDGRVIDVNIPKRKLHIPEQGLLIKGRNMKVAYQDGTSKKLLRVKKLNSNNVSVLQTETSTLSPVTGSQF